MNDTMAVITTTVTALALPALLIWMVWPKRGRITRSGAMICGDCGTRCEPGTNHRGSLAIEIGLWLCFILPGMIYSIWRLTTRHDCCPACLSANLVSITSPRGQELITRYHQEALPVAQTREKSLEEILAEQQD